MLCNVSMNMCLDDRASRVGSVISVGTLPLRRTTQWCITLQKTQRKHQRVRKCPLKYLNPPLRRVREDTFIEHRNSADERRCNFANSRKDLLDWLKALKDEKIDDIRKVYKNGVTDSVMDNYRKYLENS